MAGSVVYQIISPWGWIYGKLLVEGKERHLAVREEKQSAKEGISVFLYFL